MQNRKLAFIGSGIIGGGLAANALLKGFFCSIYDVIEPERIRQSIRSILDTMKEAGAITSEQAEKALMNAFFTNNLEEAVRNTELVQECVPEKLDMKQGIYRQIQEVCGDHAVIASSTSAMMPSVLQEGALYPECILVAHPYNPSYLLPLIELCGGGKTSEEALEKAEEVYRAMGKEPVVCRKEREGFLVNKLSWAVMDEAKKAVMEGACSVEDMDKAIMYGPGMRMAVTGQILTLSLGIQGGLRAAAAKYGKDPSEEDQVLADGIDAWKKRRSLEEGRTPEEAIRYRDRMLAGILREQGKTFV